VAQMKVRKTLLRSQMRSRRGGKDNKGGSYAKKAALRFKKGDHVACKTGRDSWEAGRIVMLLWKEPWPGGDTHPYQVRMGDGRLIYVPVDDDTLVKKIERAWWEDLMLREDLSDEQGCQMLRQLSKGHDIDAKNFDGETVLLAALRYRWTAGVHELLEMEADPNCEGQKSERALNLAVQNDVGYPVLTVALLQARADPRLQDRDPHKDPEYDSKSFVENEWHRTALHYAADSGAAATMQILLDARAEVNVKDAQYKLPLHLAIEAGQKHVLSLLIQSRSDINIGNMDTGLKTSALIDAAYRNDLGLISLLINARASLDQRGKQDMTALHVAARGRHAEATKLLVEAGADRALLVGGKTAGELAFKNGLRETAALLGYVGTESDAKRGGATSVDCMDAETRSMLFLE